MLFIYIISLPVIPSRVMHCCTRIKLYGIYLWITENQNKQIVHYVCATGASTECFKSEIFSLLTQSIYPARAVQMGQHSLFQSSEIGNPHCVSAALCFCCCHLLWSVLSAGSAPVMLSSCSMGARRLQTSAKPFSRVCPGVAAMEHVRKAAKHCNSSTGYQGILYLAAVIHRPLSLSDDGRKSLALKSLLSSNDKENVTVYQLSCSNCH